MPATPKLTYFPLRGRAEVIRLIFEELGEAYTEEHVSGDDWPTLKPQTPFGALPIYEEGELRLPQSLAIYRHIARTRNLYGTTEREHVDCDVACEAFEEAVGEVWDALWGPNDALAAFEAGALAEKLGQLERWYLRAGPTPSFWVGSALSLADFFAFRYLDEVDALFPKALTNHPALATFRTDFAARPRIAAYLASGRRPEFLGFAKGEPIRDPRA